MHLEMLRARGLVTVMVIETETEMVTWTQNKLKQRCWLEIVSICARVEERETETYQCHPCHPSISQIVCTDSLCVYGDAEE